MRACPELAAFAARRRALPWLGLAAALALFLFYLGGLRPAENFGRYHDDTLYFSVARAFTDGHGWVMPSVPGSPVQTKYPVLYPWLLSRIWKWCPSFPANLAAAVWMTAFFSCCFLIASFFLLRRFHGLGDGVALFIVVLCAFHPIFLALSGAVLSDVPFAAATMAAAVTADVFLDQKRPALLAGIPALLAGLSVMTRSLGIPVVAGILAAALYRRAYRAAAVFSLGAAPLVAAGLWKWGPDGAAFPWAGSGDPGWRQTWLFYSSYWEFWKLSVPNLDVLRAMLVTNLKFFLEGPATNCLFPPPGPDGSLAGAMLCVTLSAGILAGLVRQARSQEWKPIHFIFAFYSAVTLLWNYALMDRFLMLFLPLFYAGLWIEGRHLLGLLLGSLRPARPWVERAVAGSLALALVSISALAVEHYVRGLGPQLRAQSRERAALAEETSQLYDWIRRNTGPTTRFVAYEDVNLWLNTGRQAMRPIAFSTAAYYLKDPILLKRDLACITGVGRKIAAAYWVVTEGDFSMETGRPLIAERVDELTSVLPVVFRSRRNKVRLYDLSCLHHPETPECQAAVPVLFPTAAGR